VSQNRLVFARATRRAPDGQFGFQWVDWDLYELSLGDGAVRQLTDQQLFRISTLDASPAGDFIMYGTPQPLAERDGGIFRVNIEDGKAAPLAPIKVKLEGLPDDVTASDPSVGPRGEHVLFISNYKGMNNGRYKYNLFIATVDGKGVRQVTFGQTYIEDCDWSPQGDWMTFWSQAEGETETKLRRIREDGTDLETIPLP
jgi:dipeptidyl aminopeptidase/acylaminoacyl peptidase